jgi:hypothetical protein
MPKRRSAEEKEPKIKYFKPASVEKVESFFDAAKTYKHRLCNSIARYKEIRSKELISSINPKIAHNNKIKYSKLLILCFNKESSNTYIQIIEKKITNSLAFIVNESKTKVF